MLTRAARAPDRLASLQSSIKQQTQDLAFENYKAFVQTASCSREIFRDVSFVVLIKLTCIVFAHGELHCKCYEEASRSVSILLNIRHTSPRN